MCDDTIKHQRGLCSLRTDFCLTSTYTSSCFTTINRSKKRSKLTISFGDKRQKNDEEDNGFSQLDNNPNKLDTHNNKTLSQIEPHIKYIDTPSGSSERFPHFMGFENVKNNDAKLKGLTGVNFKVFNILLSHISDYRGGVYNNENNLLLFLSKLKQGISFTTLAIYFDTNKTTASRIFLEILKILADRLKPLIKWPTKDQIQHYYKIAKEGIHVERVIQRIRIFEILNNKIPHILIPHISDIMFVICVISNLSKPIFKK